MDWARRIELVTVVVAALVAVAGLWYSNVQTRREDSRRDQPTIANVLASYIRTHAAKPPAKGQDVSADVQAALTAFAARDRTRDGAFYLDLHGVKLPNINLSVYRAALHNANLTGADLSGMDLAGADLRGAVLESADLRGTNLNGANLRKARLLNADLGART
ncbi:pentapeptide repeat-containing protein [Streptomyces anulatus]|uniref:pentapeptide repeat-containing protein n=1 Tax=Streptomyces anulatus TaxID=1892 RepID=UPI0022547563|nr:pentapeptide repeat-containing protein [Streptomyces anulatus]MCX4503967.1 pentapeptide repeat-containing protein [Streptomyces anulatus]